MNRILHEGETWNVVSLGVTRDDGKTYAHLSHPTRGKQQKNGYVPQQICDWIEAPHAQP